MVDVLVAGVGYCSFAFTGLVSVFCPVSEVPQLMNILVLKTQLRGLERKHMLVSF